MKLSYLTDNYLDATIVVDFKVDLILIIYFYINDNNIIMSFRQVISTLYFCVFPDCPSHSRVHEGECLWMETEGAYTYDEAMAGCAARWPNGIMVAIENSYKNYHVRYLPLITYVP